MNDKQSKKLSNIPNSLHKMYIKAVTTKSPRKAIRIFCLECCGYAHKEVENCSSHGCPLFEYRLGGWPNKGEKRTKADKSGPDFSKFAPSKNI